MPVTSDPARLRELIANAKILAYEYRELTGRPLGITGEVAELEAARMLNLELAAARQAGFDATRVSPEGVVEQIQIKGRCVPRGGAGGQRVGSIQLDKPWDHVILVLLDERLELFQIHEADRASIEAEMARPGSAARERGALGVQAFIRIGRKIWPKGASELPQDRASGAAGNDFGHQTAPKIAAALGATMVGRGSNEASWRNKRAVIKCAGMATTSVGVTNTMLARLDVIIAAFQRMDGQFEVFEMLPTDFQREMRPSRSSGSRGRVGVVTRRAFEAHGRAVGTVAIE